MSKRNARDLRAFLEQRRLAWPGDFQRLDVHPLDVLLDLAINWEMPLWFSVGVLTVSATGRKSREIPHCQFSRHQFKDLMGGTRSNQPRVNR
ncbi:hypothetical protein MRX96_044319 [Rhipicephalus microplus]